MALTSGKFIIPNGPPVNGQQPMTSSPSGPEDIEEAVEYAARASSTGIIQTGEITANADNTLFDVGEVKAQFVDFTDPANPTVTMVTRPASTGESTPYRTTANVTHVGVNASGNLVLSPTPFTNTQSRTVAQIGLVAHVDRVTISVFVNTPVLSYGSAMDTQDMMRNFGTLNVKNGNRYSGNSGDLSMSRTEGWLQSLGINAFNNPNDPDTLNIASESVVQNVLKVFSDDSNEPFTGTNNEQMNPNVWEDIDGVGAGLSNEQSVPSNKWTNQLIVMFREGRTNVQVGQKLYSNKDEALADIGRGDYVVAPVIEALAVKLGVLTIKVGTTDFSDPANFEFTPAGTPHGIFL